jgi:hypothetical protein
MFCKDVDVVVHLEKSVGHPPLPNRYFQAFLDECLQVRSVLDPEKRRK